MAKYQLKNSNKKVDCELLTENEGQYVVRFKNGIVQRVPKNRISNLDKIDEGVLDTIKGIGGKLVDKIKGAARKIKEFFVEVFNVGDFVFFKTDQDNILSASHPINSIKGSQSVDSVNFIPSEETIELCDELGIQPVAVENFEFNDDYTGAFDFTLSTFVGESKKETTSLIDALHEGERLKDSEKIKLSGTFCDWDEEKIVEYIANEYMSRFRGKQPNSLPLLIWGAPGIGKTAIIRSLKDIVKGITGKDINILSINGGSVGSDDFTMPAQIERKVKIIDSKEGSYTETTIKDLPKSWLPVYDANEKDEDVLTKTKMIANGAIEVDGEITEDGPGGIFFIDEFSRMTPAGINALMQTPTSRNIGNSSALTFGDRWVIVCAANRKGEMSRNLRSEALEFEGASKTRFNHCNFVPNPENWLKWANSESKRRPGRKNILNEIISYIEDELKKGKTTSGIGDFYEMFSHPHGDLDGLKGTACPRTWEGFSEVLIDQCLENEIGTRYSDVPSIPKAKIVETGAGILGKDVAERFADFVSQFSVFTAKDAENVWTKGDSVTYEILKKQKLNSSNIEDVFNKHIFPLMKDNYPGGLSDAVSPEAALNFMKFLETCCYDGGKFNLNRFKTISQNFAQIFNVDLCSVKGPYADAANYKEDVIAKNEVI